MSKFDEVIYKIVRYGLFFIAFFPLIIFRNSFSPFNFGKVVVFRTLVEILLALYIYLAIKYPQFRPGQILNTKYKIQNIIFWALTLLTVSLALSTFLGLYWPNNFWGSFERMGGLFSWLHYYAFFIVAVNILRTKEDWLTLLKLSIVASLISTIYGFLQKATLPQIVGAEERMKIFGTLGNAAAFSGYLIFNIYFALFFLVSHISHLASIQKKYKILDTKSLFYLSVIIIESVAVLMTSIRGSILALYSTLGLFLLIYGFKFLRSYLFKRQVPDIRPKQRKRNLKICLVSLIVFLVAGCLLLVILNLNSAKLEHLFDLERITNWSLDQPTVQSRLMVWQEAILSIKDKPFLGWGPESFNIPYAKYFNPQLFQGVKGEIIFDRVHNIFLDVGVSQGILGLIIYLFLWMAVIWGVKCQVSSFKELRVFYFLIAAYFIHNFFFFDLFSTYLMGILVIGMVYVLNTADTKYQIPSTRYQMSGGKLLLPILLALAILLAYQTNIKPALANFYSTRGAAALAQDKYQKGVDYFKKAMTFAEWSHQDIRRKFAEYYTDAIFKLEGRILEKDLEEDLNYLIEELGKEKEINPFDFLNYHYLHKAYRARALFSDLDFSQAEETLRRAMSLAPNMVNLYYDLAEMEYYKKNYPAVLTANQKAYDLNPQWPESLFKLGQALILNEQMEQGIFLAVEAIKQGYRQPNDINLLGKQMDKIKDYQTLIDLYEYLVNQVSPKYNIQLSYSYLRAGQLKEAEMVADRALAMDLESIGRAGFELLAEIYQALGNDEKRAKAAGQAFGL